MAPKINRGMTDEPRVPHANAAGVQTGKPGLLPNRVYVSSGGEENAVDYMTAWSRAQQRKAGTLPPLKGGIDDDSPELYRHPEATPFGKTFAAQHKALDGDDVDRLRAPDEIAKPVPPPSEPPRTEIPPPAEKPLAYDTRPATVGQPVQVQPIEFLPGGFGEPVDTKGYETGVQSRPVPLASTVRPSHAVEQQQLQYQPVQVVEKPVYVTKEVPVFKEVEKIVEKPVEKIVEVEKPVETEFSKWYAKRCRVQLATPEMTFTVSAIAVSRSIHGVTVFLATEGDSMTFIPRAGTHIKLAFDGKVESTIFTGVSFEIEDLKLMGLCFLIREDGTDEKK
jgi:hypothetical protein